MHGHLLAARLFPVDDHALVVGISQQLSVDLAGFSCRLLAKDLSGGFLPKGTAGLLRVISAVVGPKTTLTIRIREIPMSTTSPASSAKGSKVVCPRPAKQGPRLVSASPQALQLVTITQRPPPALPVDQAEQLVEDDADEK